MSSNENFLFQTVVLPTKSLQEIITSIATKITHLIISSSNKPDASSSSDFTNPNSPYKVLVSTSDSVVESLKNLVQISKQTISNNYREDEIITEEVDVASQNLMVTGENLRLCCQVLASTNGKIISSESNCCDLDLTSCICKCFQSLVVMLLCIDNAEVRNLIVLANQLLKQLHILSSSSTLESLVENFSNFADAVEKFHIRAAQRCEDLLSATNHDKMLRALTTLTQSMPMLTTALSLAIKYPTNEEAVSAKTFALQQIEKIVNEIVDVIKARTEDTDGMKDGEIGLFISHVRSIEKTVGAEKRSNLESLELETMIQSLVQHLMALSAFTSKRVPRFSKKGNHLVKECQNLLELVSIVVKLSPCKTSESAFADSATFDHDSTEFGSVCRAIRGKLKSLQNCTLSLLTSIFCHVFTITSEPLDNLTKIHDCFRRNPTLDFRPRLQSSLSTFQSHVDDISQVAKLIQICCADPNIYRDFRPCLFNFSSITKQIVTLCSAESANPDAEIDIKNEDLMSDLQEEWKVTFKALLKCCALSLNLTQLATELENDIISDFEKSHEEVVNLDDIAFSKQVINATGQTKLLATVAGHVVKASTDAMYRNTVLAHIKQLNEAIVHVIGSSNLLIEDTARLSSQEAYLAAAAHLRTKISQLCSALLLKPNRQALTIEETRGLRDVADSSKVAGMIREMQNLNHKLASLGFEPKASSEKIPTRKPPAKKASKSQSEVVDDLFALSGPAVDIALPVEVGRKNSVSFSTGPHPLILSLLAECSRDGGEVNAMEESFGEVKRMTLVILEACEDSEACFKASNKKILGISDCPEFATEQVDDESCYSICQVVDFWRKSLSESCNLMEGLVLDVEERDLEMLRSLCKTWSKACRILLGCCVSGLRLHLINFRRFLNLAEKPGTISDETESDGSSEVIFHSKKTNGSLLEIERMSETLSILLSDVIVLYKRDLNIHQDEKKNSLSSRLDVLLDRCRKISFDLRNVRKILKGITSKVASSSNSSSISWIHVYSVLSASKLCALCSLIDTTLQLVLGVWKVNFPAELFLNDVSEKDYLKDYHPKISTLSQTTQSKITKSLANYSLESQTILKLNKMKSRVDVTCETIGHILEFIEKQSSMEKLLARHGHLVYHLMFLHHRFFLDVSRIFLVTKALSFISGSEAKDTKYGVSFTGHFPVIDPEKAERSYFPESPPKSPPGTYSERLANLTKQRKEREKELLYLLSDIDVGKSPAMMEENHASAAAASETTQS